MCDLNELKDRGLVVGLIASPPFPIMPLEGQPQCISDAIPATRLTAESFQRKGFLSRRRLFLYQYSSYSPLAGTDQIMERVFVDYNWKLERRSIR
jgi:hypothetical protein